MPTRARAQRQIRDVHDESAESIAAAMDAALHRQLQSDVSYSYGFSYSYYYELSSESVTATDAPTAKPTAKPTAEPTAKPTPTPTTRLPPPSRPLLPSLPPPPGLGNPWKTFPSAPGPQASRLDSFKCLGKFYLVGSETLNRTPRL